MISLIKLLKRLFSKLIIVISNLVYSLRLKQWNKNKGDNGLRLNYSLNRNSIVFDVGGFVGDWAEAIYRKHKCHIFIFEPVKKYYEKIVQRLSKNPRIKIFNFGLGTKDIKKNIYKMNNSSSFYKKDSYAEKEICKIRDIKNFIINNKIKKIDLIKINIEGGEFELLERIINSNLIYIIGNLQIQFHRFIPNAKIKRKKIQEKLSESHYLTYNYPFIWENWKIKNII